MFRQMRRWKQQLTDAQTKEILKNTRRGVLSVIGDDDYPYGIPINYYYDEDDNAIYFHSAKEGHKIDAIIRSNKVAFTIMNNEWLDEEDGWSCHVESVVVFGKASFVTDKEILVDRATKFARKYFPTEEDVKNEMNPDSMSRMAFIKIDIEHMSGKSVHEK
ncbi:MAG: pyridoxamine 5'-phosphate oxidase family protein [Lachnospiraceae bacterium]|nr:pyridoxamine 5'-phosphate oxidase family protein [Lachnospiraceae bacterium]